jgi:hypothetical protein
MFTYKWVDTSLAVVIQQCVAGFPVREEYLMGDDAVNFRRDYNRAKQKEQSKKCNPNTIPITQNLMADYF